MLLMGAMSFAGAMGAVPFLMRGFHTMGESSEVLTESRRRGNGSDTGCNIQAFYIRYS